ncbi:glycosyltransferase family 2 protein [Oidiodendron maius Zn]|uniref:dolichyl-phosphate beta-glucosyltransferase n=1 Tax=Oidiodendron maius (strain Zn) TaxID=913774 RepID=A0A0C3CZR1_OIDMZ|nr:glycosyltransferase family 2 protein [Oidiodendron maius Zn]
MADLFNAVQVSFWAAYSSVSETIGQTPLPVLLLLFATTVISTILFIYSAVYYFAPTPRAALPSEKTYITTAPDGSTTRARPLPCWHDEWLVHRKEADEIGSRQKKHTGTIDEPELYMSVVIPAYNEEKRLEIMLEEAVAFLDAEYGRTLRNEKNKVNEKSRGKRSGGFRGYEILIVNDGSKDKTVDIALAFSRKYGLHDILRICTLERNRGKGGAVTHGFRHVRGAYAIFVDADGASKFEDLAKLVQGCDEMSDQFGRGIAVGSRAHLVGSEAVVKRSALRNSLMHSFHLLLWLLTPPATSRIRDTQCGFKLFTRASLPYIIPYMHAEGWIFDVEMLMLAESATSGDGSGSQGTNSVASGIGIAEVPIRWKEVGGSKLNVIWDSLGMAWGLAILRLSWMVGVYKRR